MRAKIKWNSVVAHPSAADRVLRTRGELARRQLEHNVAASPPHSRRDNPDLIARKRTLASKIININTHDHNVLAAHQTFCLY